VRADLIRRTVVALLMAPTVACTTKVLVDNPKTYLVSHRPGEYWITKTDGSVVDLVRPRLMGDTLVGFINGVFRLIRPGEYGQVRTSRQAPGRTAALAVGVAATITVAGILATGKGTPEDLPDSAR
jgi:hypothetical protein